MPIMTIAWILPLSVTSDSYRGATSFSKVVGPEMSANEEQEKYIIGGKKGRGQRMMLYQYHARMHLSKKQRDLAMNGRMELLGLWNY